MAKTTMVVWHGRTDAGCAELEEQQEQDTQEQDPAKGHEHVVAVVFTRNGRLLACAGRDGAVRICYLAAGRELRRLDWSEGDAAAIAFAPDGRSLAASGSAPRA